jgi:diguanylate cyclase (GGDEF)-like protein
MPIPHPSRLQLLNEIGWVVSSTLDLQMLYETIYEQIGRVMDTTQFFIALYQPERNTCLLAYHREDGILFRNQVLPFGGNVTSSVIADGTALLVNTDEEYGAYAASHGLPQVTVGQQDSEAKIWVPLSTGDRTIGALSVQSKEPYAYSPDDLQMLSVIASQAAVAIVNAELYANSQRSVRQMQVLLDVARTISGSLDLGSCLDAILGGIHEVVPYYIATVLMPSAGNTYLDVVGATGPLSDERKRIIKVPFGQGVTGTAFSSGEPVLVGNVRNFPSYIPGHPAVSSELAVPLKRGDQVVGVLDIEREEVDAFTEDDVRTLTLFASQAAIAIENARLFAEEQQRIVELSAIQSIVQKLSSLHEIPAIAGVIETELKQLIDYTACRLYFLDAEHQVLLPVTYVGSEVADFRLHIGEGLAGWVAETGRSVIVDNTLTDPRVFLSGGRREESMIGAPLIYEGQVQGVITLTMPGVGKFDSDDLRLLEIITGQAAIVIDRARLYGALVQDAMTDPLTGLYNRRYLVERLREELSRSERHITGLSAIMLDIDKFKDVNDQFGHDAGDSVLVDLAAAVRNIVRTEDIVARYGGEEYCVLVPNITPDEAEAMAERLWECIQSRLLPITAGATGITVCVGVAHVEAGDVGESLLSRADAAMYAGKRQGGNMIHVAEDGRFIPLAQGLHRIPAGPTFLQAG